VKKLPLRQGDVCLIPVSLFQIDEIPANAEPVPAAGNKVILALGEATGHHHRFEFRDTSHDVRAYAVQGGDRYLHVVAAAKLLHEEHSTANVSAGKYLIPQQVEYTPADLHRVAD
jgi:hypothetical protein